ncbi:hypothetical protein NQ314_009519 [Rhamnusium bicolor]|uniref:Uncharacterized protein n=1 Tax=Rhamnusium bicolor TaxID=1586634 RepID=A0AAV8Y166_9CUCU|nr:hypothetical protein NQ314_009519 [Rhamnusium bicolor]
MTNNDALYGVVIIGLIRYSYSSCSCSICLLQMGIPILATKRHTLLGTFNTIWHLPKSVK